MTFMMKSRAQKNTSGARITQSVQWLGYGLDDRCSIPGKGKDFSLRHRAHPASSQMSTGSSIPEGKAAVEWS
jgi:hypothetical protein